MSTCAFTACVPATCVLPGGCVPLRFWRQVQQQREAEQARLRAPRRPARRSKVVRGGDR